MPADPVVAQAFEAWNDGDKSKGYDDRKRGFEAGYAAHRTPAPAGDVREAYEQCAQIAEKWRDENKAGAAKARVAAKARGDNGMADMLDGAAIECNAIAHEIRKLSPTPDSSAVSGSAEGLREAVFDVEPNIGAPTSEPSLRTIVLSYYLPHFERDEAESLTEAYLAALTEGQQS